MMITMAGIIIWAESYYKLTLVGDKNLKPVTQVNYHLDAFFKLLRGLA